MIDVKAALSPYPIVWCITRDIFLVPECLYILPYISGRLPASPGPIRQGSPLSPHSPKLFLHFQSIGQLTAILALC